MQTFDSGFEVCSRLEARKAAVSTVFLFPDNLPMGHKEDLGKEITGPWAPRWRGKKAIQYAPYWNAEADEFYISLSFAKHDLNIVAEDEFTVEVIWPLARSSRLALPDRWPTMPLLAWL